MSQSGEHVRLSVAMIVRNAADALTESLQSVVGIADEIVVLDTGSSDETIQVALENSAQVMRRPWDDDFSAARNACLEKVTGDWVLWLDAGESLTVEDARQLRNFVNEQASATKAYAMLVKVQQAPGSISGEQIARLRLMPNIPDIRFTGRVRESVMPAIEKLGLEVEGLSIRIHRGVRDHDPQVKVRRARRNLLLADLEIKETGPNARLLNCIGDALQTLGDTKQAAEFFRRALGMSQGASTDMLDSYYGLITSLDDDPANRPAQVAICLQALETFPLDSQLLCAMGGYLQQQGRMELAIRSYQTAYQFGQVDATTWNLDEIQDIAAVCCALAMQVAGDIDGARRYLEAAIAQNRDSLRLHRALIDLHVKNGRRVEALAQTRQLPPSMPNVEAFRSAVRGACLANEKNWIAARAYLETAYNAGCREALCLRWYVATLVALGQHDAVGPVLQMWNEMEPGNAEVQGYMDAVASAAKPVNMQIGDVDDYLKLLKENTPDASAMSPASSAPVAVAPTAAINEASVPPMPGPGVAKLQSSIDRLRRVDTKPTGYSIAPNMPEPHVAPANTDANVK